MSTETDRLAREAEERRSHLDATLDSLKGKLSPGQMVDELMTYARQGQGGEMLHNLNRQVRDNPLALGLIGAGAAWLLLGQGARGSSASSRSYSGSLDDGDRHRVGYALSEADERYGASGESYGSRARSAVSGAGHSVGSAASSVGSSASDAAGRVSGALSSAASAVSDTASSVADSANRLTHDARDAAYRAGEAGYRSVSHAGDRVSEYGRRAQRSFLDTLQEEPLILGAVALAVGAAIGAALPSTRVEDELMGETRDRLRDEALDQGRGLAEKASDAAAKAYEAGSAEAENKGLKPSGNEGETLAGKVSSVAHAAADAARDELKGDGTKGDASKGDTTRTSSYGV
ncbi:DUF3618 domain-containing protein [Aureimonas ureilytica]|uniref:DUF3618 domain-containing protein n=1 Tax=Aureimonas ureilytica TaxID=401562 RepID=UPI003CEE4950